MDIKKLLVSLLLLFFITACYEVNTIEGNYVLEEDFAKLQLGLSKQDVFKLLGASTLNSNFGENILFYSYEIYDRAFSFTSKQIKEYKTIILTFDDKDTLIKIDVKSMDDRIDVSLDSDKTIDTLRKSKFNETNIIDKY